MAATPNATLLTNHRRRSPVKFRHAKKVTDDTTAPADRTPEFAQMASLPSAPPSLVEIKAASLRTRRRRDRRHNFSYDSELGHLCQ